MRMKLLVALGATLSIAGALPAAGHATTQTLTFEGLQHFEQVGDFYNGGNPRGSTGPDYAISFGKNAASIVDSADSVPRIPFSGNPSGDTIIGFLSSSKSGSLVNVPDGFGSLSFYYAALSSGSIAVYDGPDGTGDLLATVPIDQNLQPCGTADLICHFDQVSVGFGGVARSVDFRGAEEDVLFDDLTFEDGTDGGTETAITGSGSTRPLQRDKKANRFDISALGQSGTLTYTGSGKTPFRGTIQCVNVVGPRATIVAVDSATGKINRTMVRDSGAKGDKLANVTYDPATLSAKARAKALTCVTPDADKLAKARTLAGDVIQIDG